MIQNGIQKKKKKKMTCYFAERMVISKESVRSTRNERPIRQKKEFSLTVLRKLIVWK